MVGAGTMLDTETDGVLEPNRARLGPCSDETQKKFAMESYWFEVLNEVYLQFFLLMGCKPRDESNDAN